MIYAKLQRDHWNSPAWRLASLRQRGAAISLVAYCAEAENGGRIIGAARWATSRWLAAAGLTRRAVDGAVEAGLCAWQGDDLVVLLYDRAGEDAYRRQTASPPPLAPPQPPPPPAASAPTQPDPNPNPNPNPRTPTPSPSSESPPPPTTATATRIDGVDAGQVRQGLADRDHRTLITAFGCQVTGKESEWDQACDGLSHEALVAILHLARHDRDPIRLPSGLRTARTAWQAIPHAERQTIGRRSCAHYGALLPGS